MHPLAIYVIVDAFPVPFDFNFPILVLEVTVRDLRIRENLILKFTAVASVHTDSLNLLTLPVEPYLCPELRVR